MNIGALIAFLFFLFIGLLVCVTSLVHSIRLKRWSVVICNVTDSKITLGKDSETNSTIYMITISLSYKFGISTYNHKDAKTVYQSSDSDQASAKLSEYPIGKEIKVWCNPGEPKQYMVLEDFWGLGSIWIGLLLIGVGIVIAYFGH